jgi:hypothetical protein
MVNAIPQKFVDIYDTTIDDLMIRGLVQQSRYKDYFMGRSIGHGLDNNELCLRTINRSKDTCKMVEALNHLASSSSF